MSTDREWRTTTATRIFALALVLGADLRLDAGDVTDPALVLSLLGCVALAVCAVDLHPSWRRSAVPIALEAGTVAVLASAAAASEAVLVYVAVIIVVAGYRHGLRGTLLAGGISAAVLAVTAADTARDPAPGAIVFWTLAGLGGGLLVAHQRRWSHHRESVQAPYVSAYRNLAGLHELATQVGFDQRADAIVAELAVAVRAVPGMPEAALEVVVDSTDGPREHLLDEGHGVGNGTTFPARVGDRVFGKVVVWTDRDLAAALVRRLQSVVDEHAIRLDGALLLEGVRRLATREERLRLARDLHDGPAQRATGVRLLAEDLAAALEGDSRRAVTELTSCVDDLVADLRCSLLDLHHEVGAEGLATSLAELVRALGRHSALRVHLTLDEHGGRLRACDEEEILRVAQEAITNARRHAHALNLWVHLTRRDGFVRLAVEDDGIGAAAPRPDHYGLRTMAERARRVGGDLAILPRPDGGTIVRLEVGGTVPVRPSITEGGAHEHHRAAGR